MPRRHEVSEYEAFVSGETAQVVARDDRDGKIVILARGEAAAVRPIAVDHYSCPIPGCTEPRPLSTRGGSKRDHFFHRISPSHPGGRESLDHMQAKHMLAAWAARVTGNVPNVQVNEEEWSPDSHRRPDVMVTWPDRRRVALEVEYKPFTVEAWQAKQVAYLAAGITPVWLFGHAPNRYLRRDARPKRDRDNDQPGWRLVPLTQAVASAGLPVLFVNPVEEQIGTAWAPGTPLAEARTHPGWWQSSLVHAGQFRAPTPDRGVAFRLALCDLDECTLDPNAGLRTPMVDEIEAEGTRVLAAINEDKDTEEQRRAAARAKRLARRALGPATAAPSRPQPAPTGYRCHRCGRPLDPSLAKSGRHILC